MIERFNPDELPVRSQHASQVHGVTSAEPAQRPVAPPMHVEQDDLAHGGGEYEVHEDAHTEASEEDSGKPRKGLKMGPWITSTVVMGALIGGIIILFLKFVSGPGEGVVNDDLAKAQAAAVPKPVTSTLSGHMISLTYPGIFDQVINQNQGGEQDKFMLGSKVYVGRAIAIAVLKLSNLDDDSGYKYRMLHPELYKQTLEKRGKDMVVVMAKNDNTEQTLFWSHKGHVLNVSITSTSPHDNVADFMKLIKPSVRWLK